MGPENGLSFQLIKVPILQYIDCLVVGCEYVFKSRIVHLKDHGNGQIMRFLSIFLLFSRMNGVYGLPKGVSCVL